MFLAGGDHFAQRTNAPEKHEYLNERVKNVEWTKNGTSNLVPSEDHIENIVTRNNCKADDQQTEMNPRRDESPGASLDARIFEAGKHDVVRAKWL